MRGRERKRAAAWGRPYAAALALAIALSGCTTPPAAAPTPEPTPEATLSPVYTDWSKLEPYTPQDREEVYVRYWKEPRFTLTPSPDYGPLITFEGAAITGHTVSWDFQEWGDGQYSTTDRLYGLMTPEGKVVVEPVYNDVTGVVMKNEAGQYEDYPGAKVFTQYAADSPTRYRYTVSATDGSWTTGPVYICMDGVTGDHYESYYGYSGYDGEALFALREDGYLVLLDPRSGREKASFPLPDYEDIDYFSADLGEDLVTLSASYGSYADDTHTDRIFCWDLAGNSIPLPEEVISLRPYSEGLALAYTDKGYGFIDRDGRWVISPKYSYATGFEKGRALVRKSGEGYFFINPRGKALTEAVNTDHVSQTGEYWVFTGYDGDAGLVLDGNLQPVDSPLLHQGYVTVMNCGWAEVETEAGPLLVRGTESWPVPEGYYLIHSPYAVREDTLVLDGEEGIMQWNPEKGTLLPLPPGAPGDYQTSLDPITGEPYQRITYDYKTVELQDAAGKTLFRADDCNDFYGDSWPSLVGGNCLCEGYGEDSPTVLLSPDGKVLMKKYWEDGLD